MLSSDNAGSTGPGLPWDAPTPSVTSEILFVVGARDVLKVCRLAGGWEHPALCYTSLSARQ